MATELVAGDGGRELAARENQTNARSRNAREIIENEVWTMEHFSPTTPLIILCPQRKLARSRNHSHLASEN